MKKTIVLATLFACLLMASCTATQNTEEVMVLQSQVEELQKELDNLQSQPETDTPSLYEEDSTATMSQEASAESDTVEQIAVESSLAGVSVESYNISGLETAVSSIVEKISAATVSGDAQTDRAVFWELYNELESIDNQLDQMDDLTEVDFHNGVLPRGDYLELDRQLDALEDQLGQAENALEFKFGVDD